MGGGLNGLLFSSWGSAGGRLVDPLRERPEGEFEIELGAEEEVGKVEEDSSSGLVAGRVVLLVEAVTGGVEFGEALSDGLPAGGAVEPGGGVDWDSAGAAH